MAVEITTPEVTRTGPSLADKARAVQACVDSILTSLDNAGIAYCLLRNRHQIPWGLLKWSDLDILVPADAPLQRLVKVLSDLKPAQIVDVRPGVVTMSFPVEDLFLRVDFCYGDLDWRGAVFAYADEVLADRWDDDGIMVASRLHQAYVTWISKLVWSGFYSENYTSAITEAHDEQPEQMHALLERTLGSALAGKLTELIRSGRLVESEALIPEIRRQLWRRSLRRAPVRQLRASALQTVSRVRTLIYPSGLVVALVGPTGTGKSSVVETLKASPARHMPCGRIDHLTQERRVLLVLPGTGRPGAGQNLIVATYNGVNEWLAHLKWTRYRLTRGRLVIDERPSLVASLAAGRKGTSWIDRWHRMLAPGPDLIIALDAPTDTLLQRSLGTPPDVVISEREKCATLSALRPDVHHVHAEQPVDRIMADVRDLIIETYKTRTRHRYQGART